MRKIALTILISVLVSMSAVVYADFDFASAFAPLNVADMTPVQSTEPAKEIGVAASEVLPGNGSRAGYVLGHGNVVTDSEWVYVGPKRAKRNVDYSIDYSSGTLFFTEPVRQSDSVRVDYRHSQLSKGERSVTGPGMMPLNFGNAMKMNMTYSYRAADTARGFAASDILTYGMNTITKFGASSTISSMMYVATPQASNRLSLGQTPNPTNGVQSQQPKKGQLMVQDADLGLGKVRLKMGFQDVGENFAGFASLRESNASAGDVINQLEKEKGLKRMSVAADIPTGKTGGFSFAIGRIEDKTTDISSRAFGYSGSAFKFNLNMREIGKEFSRFKDLREADSAQMANEIGMKRTSYGMQFRTGIATDSNPAWSGLRMTNLQDENGSLNYKSANFAFGRVKLEADIRRMDPTYNRMAALNDEERTRMALIARRQFNPKAQAAEVTAQDKAQINNEAGLDRKNYEVEIDGGPVDTWLSLSSIDSQKGGLKRSAINVEGKAFSFFFKRHSIDDSFDRLANLQAIELANFGNEYGMSRALVGGTFKFAGGETSVNHASVTDHQGASVIRQSLDVKAFKNFPGLSAPRLQFHANLQNINSEFSRLADLSDADRNLLVQERGFSRSDYAINFQATKSLNIESYLYDSTSITAGQTRGQSRQRITYTPSKGPQISAFQDNYSYVSETGNLSSYSRRKITFDNSINIFGGLLFKSLSDVNTTQEGIANPIQATTTQTHLESKQTAKTSFTLDTLNVDYGTGKFDATRAIGLRTQAMKNIAFVTSFARTTRDSGNTEANGTVGIDWTINKNLKMTMNVANRDGGQQGSQQAKKYSLNGLLAKRFLMFDNIKIGSASNTTMLTGKQIGCDNAMKLEAGLLGGSFLLDNSDKLNPKNGMYYTSRILHYNSNPDPKSWYHITFFRQNLIAPTGEPAEKRNYALDMRFTSHTSLTYTSYFGKDGQNGAVLPVGGTQIKISHTLNNKITLIADYHNDINKLTLCRARVFGFGISRTLSENDAFEFYYGFSHLVESFTSEDKNVFRVKYDHKVDADHFLTISGQKKSGIDKTTINPYEGDTTARIDFRTLFN